MVNNKGNILLTTLIVLAVSAGTIYIFSDFFKTAQSINKKSDSLDLLSVIEDGVIWSIENDESWKATVNGNAPTMNCLSTSGAVCTAGVYPLNVYMADGSLYANGNTAGAGANIGFDYYGTPCVGFSATVPNDQCPFKLKVTWTPQCVGACNPTTLSAFNGVALDPNVKIDIEVLYSGNSSTFKQINLQKRFKKSFIRG